MPLATDKVKAVFLATLDRATPAERTAFLDEACAGDAALRQRVEALLQAHDQADCLLDRPAAEHLSVSHSVADGAESEQSGVVVAGRYKLLEQIGEGGMGTVWVAEQTQPVRRKVALKLIKAGMDSRSVLARFEAERQALALMDHPNIAKVHDAGKTESGRPFFVMEYVKGVPITQYCDDSRLTIGDRLALFVSVCQAVQHAHQKGIIHRDLKPSNILVCQYDGVPVPKVIDFGLAKATHQPLTEDTLQTAHGVMMGTPLYMSPEQAEFNNLDVDTRTDIYALGVILYELLTGTTPVDRKRLKETPLLELLRIIREEETIRPSSRLSTVEELPSIATNRGLGPKKLSGLVRGELDWIVGKALEKDRNRRYETANGFALDVQRYLAGEPVLAALPSARYRLRKFARKYRAVLATTAAIFLLLVAGVAVSTWQAVRATRAEAAARLAEQQALQAQLAERERAEGERKAKLEAQIAAQTEAAAKREALGAVADTKAFADFLANHVLAAPRPQGVQGGFGVNVTIAEAMAKAEPELEKVFRDRPRAEALTRQALGVTWRNLGKYTEAIRHLERAWTLRRERLGADNQDTLNSMNSLAMAYQAADKLDRALPLFEEALQLRRATLGADHPDTLASMNCLAEGYRAAGKLDLALPLLEETVNLQKAKRGVEYPSTLASMNNLALGYRDAGRLDLALPLLEETLQLAKVKRGADHPDTLTSMNNLAEGYRVAGKLDLAVPLLEETLELRRAKLGADHLDTLTSMNNLALAYQAARKVDLALPLFEETLRLRKANLGPHHRLTLTSVHNLAGGYQAAGKLSQALPLFEETLELRRAKLGADHPDTLTNMNSLAEGYRAAGKRNLALPLFEEAAVEVEKRRFQHGYAGRIIHNLSGCYEQLKQFEQAEAWRRKWLDEVKKRSGGDSIAYANELMGLGLNLLGQKRWTDAERTLRECLAIRESKEPDGWTVFNAKSVLGGALLGQKNYADAEPLLVAGYEGLKQRAAKIPPSAKGLLTDALRRLVQLYEALGKPDEAARWRAELEKARTP